MIYECVYPCFCVCRKTCVWYERRCMPSMGNKLLCLLWDKVWSSQMSLDRLARAAQGCSVYLPSVGMASTHLVQFCLVGPGIWTQILLFPQLAYTSWSFPSLQNGPFRFLIFLGLDSMCLLVWITRINSKYIFIREFIFAYKQFSARINTDVWFSEWRMCFCENEAVY